MPSQRGRCPHCKIMHELRGSGDDKRMSSHLWRPPGGRYTDCPGTGKRPQQGTVK